ncbi:hypothetical protein C8F01DRAFT_1377865 [Mycena amicta]|nr:hypothetical protein C8F01DRAFT_1377865 [Mycena amicta]
MLRTLRLPIPSDYLERIAGTATTDVKAMAVKWLNVYHAPAPRCFAGMSAKRTVVTDVSLDNEGLGRSRRLTLVSEIDVTEDELAQAFVITIIDECVSSPVATLDYAEGGAGMSTLSLSLNTTFHNPALLCVESYYSSRVVRVTHALPRVDTAIHKHHDGGRRRNPVVASSVLRAAVFSSDVPRHGQVRDLREQHLVASAIFSGLLSSPLKTKAARL